MKDKHLKYLATAALIIITSLQLIWLFHTYNLQRREIEVKVNEIFFEAHKPDVIIADIEMPEMNGFEMVEKIRAVDGETLILFASGRVSPKDVTAAYKLGANNYLDAHIKGDK